MAAKIDEEVEGIINEASKRAESTLSKQKPILDLIANTLLEKETIEGKDFDKLVESVRELNKKQVKAKAQKKAKE